MRKRILVVAVLGFILICGVLLFVFREKEPENFFEYVVKVEDGKLLPKRVDYLKSLNQVKWRRMFDDSVVSNFGASGKHKKMVTTLELENFPYDIEETIYFAEDKAVRSVEYCFSVWRYDIHELVDQLQEQADAYMPEPTEITENDVEEEGRIIWKDEEGNQVIITKSVVPAVGPDEIAYLKVYLDISKTTLKEFMGIQADAIAHPTGYETYAGLIGKTKDVVLQELNIREEDLEKQALFPETWYLSPIEVECWGYPFQVLLYFEEDTGCLYGFSYELNYEKISKAEALVVEELYYEILMYCEAFDLFPRYKDRIDLADWKIVEGVNDNAFRVRRAWNLDKAAGENIQAVTSTEKERWERVYYQLYVDMGGPEQVYKGTKITLEYSIVMGRPIR